MKRLSGIPTVLLAVAMMFQLAACDSSDDIGGEPLSAETSAAMAETVEDVFTVIPLAMSEVQAAKDQSPAGACPEGGSFSVEGSASASQSSFDLDVQIDFDGCNGLDGSLDIDGNGSFTPASVMFDLELDGTVSGQCSLTFDNFREQIVADFTTDETVLTLDGRYHGSCSGEGFTCAFNDVEIDADSAPSSSLMEQSCWLN